MKNPFLKFVWIFALVFSIVFLFSKSKGIRDYFRSFPAWEEHEGEEDEKESGVSKQMETWWWSRAYPEPKDMEWKYAKAWEQAQALKHPEILSGAQGTNGSDGVTVFGGNWLSIGPDQTIGGRILSIAIDPNNGNRIFIGSASGGIWKTTTGGSGSNAWQPVETGYPVLGVGAIVIDPSNSNVLYAGTGEVYRLDSTGSTPNPGNAGYSVWKARGTYGVGILKSTDGGVTWTQVLAKVHSNMFGIQRLRFDPTNSAIIYACATDGLYRSTNSGASWTKILSKTLVTDVVINASNTNQLVAAVGNLGNTDKGIYRSTDGGSSWTKITSGLPSSFQGFIKMDYVTSNSSTIVASVGVSESASRELYQTTNFGSSWSSLSSSAHCSYQYWCAHNVAINPSNTNRFIYGGVNLYSYSLPSSYSPIGSNVHSDVHDIQFDPSNSNNVYVACDGGIYKSTNGGSSWSAANGGLYAVQFYASFGVSTTDPNFMVGGLQDNGVVVYNGSSWTNYKIGDGTACAVDPNNDNNVVFSRDARGIYQTSNQFSNYTQRASYWGFSADSRTAFVAPVAYAKSSSNIVYAGTDNLHISTNGGVNWTGNSYGSATSYIDAQHKTAIALGVSPVNANKIYASVSPFAQYDNDVDNLYVNLPANVLKSTNGGSSFTSIKGSLPDRFVMDFAISPTDDDSVWIVLGGFGTSHVYVTGDGGSSWTAKGSTLPDVPHNAVLLDPNDPKIIYVGNDLGVYMSPDNGTTWYDFNNAFWDATLVMDLQALPNDKLVAATHGKGAFVSDLYSASLPVTLADFTGKNEGSYNLLSWKTSTEANVDHFELERSPDGIAFTPVGRVAAGNTITGAGYNHKDNISNIRNRNILYYRLKIVDRDGSFIYSNVITIRIPVRTGMVVSGNPFRDRLTVGLEADGEQSSTLSLYDATGKLVVRRQYHTRPGQNTLVLDQLSYLARGTYVLELKNNTQHFVEKVLRK